MLSIRFVTVSAVILLFSGMAAGGATAQTAANETPGKPMQILRIVEQPAKAAKPHAQTAAKSHRTHHYARVERTRPHLPAQTAAAPAADDVSPTANSAAPTDVAAAEPAPAPQFAATPSAPTPGELVIGGQTVQVASPDAVDIDLAAKDANAQASTAAPSATASMPAANTTAANPPVTSDGAEPTPKSETANTASAPSQGSPVGSTSWLLQVFAALGGAVAAGSVAWFLIGSAPQRTYG